MPRSGFFAAGVAAGGAAVVFLFAGFIVLLLVAIYAFVAAILAVLAVACVETRRPSFVIPESLWFLFPFLLAFVVSGAAAFVLDLIFKTHVSIPAMINALDLTHNVAARPQPLVEGVLDYYAVALGPTPRTWLRYVGMHVAIVLVFAGVVRWMMSYDEELEPEPPLRRNLRILALSAVAVGTAAVTVFPLTTWAMIALRGLQH